MVMFEQNYSNFHVWGLLAISLHYIEKKRKMYRTEIFYEFNSKAKNDFYGEKNFGFYDISLWNSCARHRRVGIFGEYSFDVNLTISENGLNTGNYLTRLSQMIGNFYDITFAISTPLKEHKKGIFDFLSVLGCFSGEIF